MRITSLLPLLLLSTACVTEADDFVDDDTTMDGKNDSPTTPRALVASRDPNALRLAAVENVLGFGMRAITLWERDTMANGRDLWLTLRASGSPMRVWKTLENILTVDAVQSSSNGTKFIGTENTPRADGATPALEFWLSVGIEQQLGAVLPTLRLNKQTLDGQHAYTVQSRDDAFATFLGQIDDMERLENADHLVRLFEVDPTLGQQPNQKQLFLVLTDHEGNHVFPLGLRVNGANRLAFASAREITFDAKQRQPDGLETSKRYKISWTDASAPSIRLVQ